MSINQVMQGVLSTNHYNTPMSLKVVEKKILIAEIALRIPKVTASLSKNPSKVDPNFIDDLL